MHWFVLFQCIVIQWFSDNGKVSSSSFNNWINNQQDESEEQLTNTTPIQNINGSNNYDTHQHDELHDNDYKQKHKMN